MSVTVQIGNSRSTSGDSGGDSGCLGCVSVLVFVCIVLPLCIWAGRYCWGLAFP